MYNTSIGSFDGDSWEEFCQVCLKIKYKDQGYQELPATFGGDLGIEGYTRTGIVVQCYCPDGDYPPQKQYELQRDKITKDLKKLIKNQKELPKYLGDTPINKWIFLTPEYKNKELVKHAVAKRDEYRKKNLPILDQQFDVLIEDIKFFAEEKQVAFASIGKKIIITSVSVTNQEVDELKSDNVIQVTNLSRKAEKLFNLSVQDQTEDFIKRNIKYYIKGIRIIQELEKEFQPQYERFIKIISTCEDDVEDDCALSSKKNNELYQDIRNKLHSRLNSEFNISVDSVLLDDLRKYVIADWLMRCPLDFY